MQSNMHQQYSRSHDAVIRVYDAAGNVVETHEHKGEFKSGDPGRTRKAYAAIELGRGKLPTRIYPPAGACFMFV